MRRTTSGGRRMSLPALSPFGEKLRAWRRRRGLSQLDLALAAETTPRYVSFIETGRSRPGREVVLRLAEALQLSLRDQNILLVAAGLKPLYTERSLDDAALAPIRAIIDSVLDNHNPYPAFAFAPGLQLLCANATAERLFPGMTQLSPEQLVTAWCTPPPGAASAKARRDAYQVVAMLRRELTHHPHPDLPRLLDHAEQLARALGPAPELTAEDADNVVMCSTLDIGDAHIKTIATVMRFDKPADVTVSELRVELIFPANDESEAFFKSLAIQPTK